MKTFFLTSREFQTYISADITSIRMDRSFAFLATKAIVSVFATVWNGDIHIL